MTATYPKPPESIIQFARRFPDEASCAAHLLQLRYPDGYACPKCGARKVWPVRERPGMMICDHDHKVSLTAGTGLHRTKIPLLAWFHAAWLVATLKPGISAVQFQRQLGLTRLETAWTMLHKLRAGMVAPDRAKLTTKCSNPDHTAHWIEVDHIEVGGPQARADKREGRPANKAIVIVAVEVHAWHGEPDDRDVPKGKRSQFKPGWHTRAGRCRLRVVPNAGAYCAQKFISECVEFGSYITTDYAQALYLVGHAGMRRYERVNASEDPDPLPTLGRVVTNLKRWIIGTHKGAVQVQHLQAYLNEYVFRFNRRDIPWVAFNRVLALAVLKRPALEYEGLYKHTWVHPNPTKPEAREQDLDF